MYGDFVLPPSKHLSTLLVQAKESNSANGSVVSELLKACNCDQDFFAVFGYVSFNFVERTIGGKETNSKIFALFIL